MKSQKGINNIAIIIGVIIGLIIVAIGGFLILSNGNKKETETPQIEQEQIEENTEITEEEKKEITAYLKKYAYVAIMGQTTTTGTHETMSQEAAMIYMSTSDIEPESDNINNFNNTNTISNTVNANTLNTNTIGNTTTSNTNTIGNTSTLSDNRLTMDINSVGNSVANTVDNTMSNIPTVPNNQTQNILGISENTIQNALFEMFGQKLDNLSQILQTEIIKQDLSEVYITQIQDLNKSNGIYTAVFDSCLVTKADKEAGTNIYGLDSYTIQVKFEKNEDPEYSAYKLSSITITLKTTPIAYHISYVDGKYGIIDNNGIVIIEAKYSKVELPNSYIGLFICYTDDTTQPIMLNERGIQQFKDYDSASLIKATAGTESSWNEDNIVLVEKDGYFGAVDFKENVIYDTEYDEIVPLGYEREKLVLTKNGSKALADTKGNILSDFAYSKIGILGVDFEPSVLVTQTRTQEEVLAMMQENDYILGLGSTGTYTILETKGANDTTPVMSTLAKAYEMTIGTSWQLAVLDNTIPVYVKQQTQVQQ